MIISDLLAYVERLLVGDLFHLGILSERCTFVITIFKLEFGSFYEQVFGDVCPKGAQLAPKSRVILFHDQDVRVHRSQISAGWMMLEIAVASQKAPGIRGIVTL